MTIEGYTTIKGPRGGVRYKFGRKFVKTAEVPEDIRSKFEVNAVAEEAPRKICIFCGGPGTYQRLINQQSIALCPDDYYDKNMGQIAQRLREMAEANHGKS